MTEKGNRMATANHLRTYLKAALTALDAESARDARFHIGRAFACVPDEDEIRAALEGESNDAEHDALVMVADGLGIEWVPFEERED